MSAANDMVTSDLSVYDMEFFINVLGKTNDEECSLFACKSIVCFRQIRGLLTSQD